MMASQDTQQSGRQDPNSFPPPPLLRSGTARSMSQKTDEITTNAMATQPTSLVEGGNYAPPPISQRSSNQNTQETPRGFQDNYYPNEQSSGKLTKKANSRKSEPEHKGSGFGRQILKGAKKFMGDLEDYSERQDNSSRNPQYQHQQSQPTHSNNDDARYTRDGRQREDLENRVQPQVEKWAPPVPPKVERKASPFELKVKEQESVIQQLQTALNREHDQVLELQEKRDKMQLVLDNKELYVGHQANDDMLRGQFSTLMRSIKTWAQSFPKSQDRVVFYQPKNMPSETVEELFRVAPGYSSLHVLEKKLLDPRDRRLFIRGWISLILVKNFFRCLPDDDHLDFTGSDAWLESKVAQSVEVLETTLFYADQEAQTRVLIKDVHDWRALTASLLSRTAKIQALSKEREVFLQNLSAETVDIIRDWAPEKTREELVDGLSSIFRGAISLSRLFRCQRACWNVRFPMSNDSSKVTGCIQLDNSIMEDGYEDDKVDSPSGGNDALVDLVVEPFLTKRGNAEGEHFEQKAVIQKALICLR